MELTGTERPQIDPLCLDYLEQQQLQASVLRLDRIHPFVSGNKWYKLKEYLNEAVALQKKVIVTFGGAFSNHILATAVACTLAGFKSVGIIRGEKPRLLSPTLQDALAYNMHLVFTSRENYKKKMVPDEVFDLFAQEELYTINEGGYGRQGMLGAASILKETDTTGYTHLLCALGTGTTLAGIRHQALPVQQVIGISVLKNLVEAGEQVGALLPQEHAPFTILHQFHLGGYAKYNSTLIRFMNDWYQQTGIPSDFVYTGKLFYAFEQLCREQFFPTGSKILLVHSGGLQGNRSLPAGTLIF